MTTVFPNLKPGTREIQLGQYPVKRFTTMAGTGVTRRYGSQPFNASLSVSFPNVSDQVTQTIVEAYESASGPYDYVVLPDLIWDGISTTLRQKLERDYVWRFTVDTPPQIQSIKRGVSSVTVRFEGQRDSTAALAVNVSIQADEEYTLNRLDPYFYNVQMLLYMKGRNNTYVFNDSSSKARQGFLNGDTKISTEQSIFDGSSGKFDGNQDYIVFPPSNDFVFGVLPYTIEAWIYLPQAPSGNYAAIVDMRDNPAPTGAILLAVNSSRQLVFYSLGAPSSSGAEVITLQTWTHVAVSRDSSGRTGLYVNGVEAAFATDTSSKDQNGDIYIGRVYDNFHAGFNGYMSNLRITKGVGRYSASFTPSTTAFPSPGNLPTYLPPS